MSLVRFKTNDTPNNKMVESFTVFNADQVDTKKQPMFFGKLWGAKIRFLQISCFRQTDYATTRVFLES